MWKEFRSGKKRGGKRQEQRRKVRGGRIEEGRRVEKGDDGREGRITGRDGEE